MRIGPMEFLLVVFVALLLWGPTRLPELGRSLGRSIHEFRRGLRAEVSDAEPLEKPPSGSAPTAG